MVVPHPQRDSPGSSSGRLDAPPTPWTGGAPEVEGGQVTEGDPGGSAVAAQPSTGEKDMNHRTRY